MTAEERAEILVTARLLRAAGILRWLAASLVVLAGVAIVFRHSSISAIVAIAAGLIAIYHGIRVSFDAKLLEDVAMERLTTGALDAGLGNFAKTNRPWSERCRGAKRLALRMALATIAQVVAIVTIGWS